MSVISTVRRPALVAAAALTAIAVGAAPAMAHHCFVPMYTSPDRLAQLVRRRRPDRRAAHPRLRGRLRGGRRGRLRSPGGRRASRSAIKIFEKMTIGDPKETGRTNPNGADGRGLEYFGAGSTVADEMVATWIEARLGRHLRRLTPRRSRVRASAPRHSDRCVVRGPPAAASAPPPAATPGTR